MIKKVLSKKNAHILLLLILLAVCVGIFLYRSNIALFAWNNYKADKIVVLLEKKDATLYMKMGYYYFGGGAYDLVKAEKYFLQALEIEDTIPYAHFQLGRIYFINGKFWRSIEELNTELKIHPEIKRAHYVLGLVYGYRGYAGDLENAESHFKKFIEWAPSTWAGYNDLAWIEIRLEKYKEAKGTTNEAFKKISWTSDTNPWLWTTLGIAELNLKDYTKSRDAFLKARRISEKLTAQYFISAYPGNDPRNADTMFNQYKATISFNLGVVYEKLGDTKNAKREYEEYLKMIPEGPFPNKNEITQKIKNLSE